MILLVDLATVALFSYQKIRMTDLQENRSPLAGQQRDKEPTERALHT